MTDRTRRVLQVITGIDVGGAENQLLTLSRGLRELDIDVTVAYLKGTGELAPRFREASCEVVSVDIRTDADPLGALRLVRHVRARDYDVIHGHLFHGTVYGSLAATLGDVPAFVVSKHNDHPFWADRPYRAIHNLTVSRADRVLCLSDHVRSYLIETTAVDPSLVETVYYGLDPSPFDAVDDGTIAATRREFAPDDTPLVGSIARLTEQKDLGVLLKAFDRVLDDHPDARLAIVGRGEKRTDLEELAKDRGIDDRVTFAGFRTDVPALMGAFDLFALPSRWEGLGVVFLEAMAAATPIVATDTSAIPEVVVDGETGLLVPPGDASAFAAAIDGLLADPDRRAAMGERGRDRLESQFTPARMVDRVLSVYDQVLSETSGPR